MIDRYLKDVTMRLDVYDCNISALGMVGYVIQFMYIHT